MKNEKITINDFEHEVLPLEKTSWFRLGCATRKTINVLDKFILLLLLLSLLVITSRAECEKNMALDMETLKCIDVNLTLNPQWKDFY